jgi:hypothetical protein
VLWGQWKSDNEMTLNTLVDVRMLTTMVLKRLQALVMVDWREWTPCCVVFLPNN